MPEKKIVIIQRQFSHYRKPIFDELGKSYKIYLLYGGVDSSIKEAEAPYAIKIRYLKYWKKITSVFLFGFTYMHKVKPDIVIHEANPSILSLPIVFIYCRLMGVKFVLWGHGYNRTGGFNPKSDVKTMLRLYLMKKADAVILYSQETKKEIENYIPKNKLFVAQNSLDSSWLSRIRTELLKDGIEPLKRQLNIKAKYNLIFVGRILSSKKIIVALDVINILSNKYNLDVQYHIIGEGNYLKNIEEYISLKGLDKSVILHGQLYDEKSIGSYFLCSDLMLFPGDLGLSINHAFSFDCPVFTFKSGNNGPYHGPEIENLINGNTGFLVNPYDCNEMAEKIIYYLNSPELQNEIKSNIRNTSDNIITLENMASGFLNCFNYLNSNEK